MLEVLQSLVNIESPSLEKEMVDEVAKAISKLFTEYVGGSVKTIANEQYGDHLLAEWGEGEEQILILCHMDTVWPKGTLKNMPFCVKGDKAYGPGTFDMKGGIVQSLFALHALKELEVPLNKKIVMLFTSDEEIGSRSSQMLIEEQAKKSKYVLVVESASTEEGKWKTSRKGVGLFNLKVTGHAAHAGIEPEKGISAIEELANQILYLHSLSDYDKGTTVNVGVIKGGTTSNVIAASAEAVIDLRVQTQAEFDRVIPLIEELTPYKEGIKLEVTGGVNRPPMEKTEATRKIYKIGKRLAREYLNMDLQEDSSGGGSDGNFASQYAATIDGLGPVGDGAHASHEHLVISQMPKRSILLALLLEQLANE